MWDILFGVIPPIYWSNSSTLSGIRLAPTPAVVQMRRANLPVPVLKSAIFCPGKPILY
ncbi:MAG: hypothetical protein V7K14_07295 [Nostoc sp.]|uniref:hypothetical protein n=1 Tax=Nostoc sp. TaxID=1180 RepID=UPI002FFC240A